MRCPFNHRLGRFLGALELTPWAGALSEWILGDMEEGRGEAVISLQCLQSAVTATCYDCIMQSLHLEGPDQAV